MNSVATKKPDGRRNFDKAILELKIEITADPSEHGQTWFRASLPHQPPFAPVAGAMKGCPEDALASLIKSEGFDVLLREFWSHVSRSRP